MKTNMFAQNCMASGPTCHAVSAEGRRHHRLPQLGRLVLVLVLVLVPKSVSAADTPGKPPSVLVVGRTLSAMPPRAHDKLVVKPLSEAGFQINVCEQADLPEKLASGKYNILAWVPIYDVTNDADLARYKEEFPRVKKAVEEFLARGGTLFMPGPSEQQAIPATWALTEQWGLRVLCERIGARDGGVEYFGPHWAYTTKISGPAAPGVKGVWFPRNGGFPHPGCKWWWPLEVDSNWDVVVMSEKETGAPVLESWSPDVDKGVRKKPVTDGVPLAAVRELKPGRIAVMTLPQTYSFASPHNWPGGPAALFDGVEGKPSDGSKVMVNLFKWLAETATKTNMGGATTPPELFKPVSGRRVQPSPPVTWAPRFFKGLIGARTTLSTGKSTVAQYAKAAKAAGLDYLVILEDHKAMSPEKNEKLRQECRVVSDATFQAIPGYTIEDEFGNPWFFAGDKATHLKDVFLSADGKVMAGHYNKPDRMKHIPEADRHGTETLGYTICNLTGGYHQYQVLTGSWNHKRAVMPPWDYRDYNAVALVTYNEKGELVDDVIKDYPLLQQKGNKLEPFSMTLMDSADQIAMHLKKGFVNHTQGADLPSLAKAIGSWRGDIEADQFISNGPEIVEWQCSNWTYPHLIADEFRVDLMRNAVTLHVKSPAGLREVSVYDGTRLIRRFLPGGAKEFKQTLEIFNVPQQHFMLIVEDKQGHRAISKDLITKNPNFQEFLCGDRNNQLFNGYTPRPDGSIFYYAPVTGNSTTPDKGPACWMMSPCRPFSYDEWSPSCPWDGGVIPVGRSMDLTPRIAVEGEPELPLHNSTLRRLHSDDVQIGEAEIDGGFEEQFRESVGMVWGTILPVKPTRYLEGTMRLTYWRLKADIYTAALFEDTIRFKNAATLKDETSIHLGLISVAGEGVKVEVRDSGGKVRTLVPKELKEPAMFTLDDTGYVSIYDKSCNQTFFSLAKGLRCTVAAGQVLLFPTVEGKAVKKGAEFHMKLLGIGSTPGVHPDAASVADKAYGITSGKPAYSLKLQQGKAASQRHQVQIASEGGAAVGTISKHAVPGLLPIVVSGLNPNATVAYYDALRQRWRPVGAIEDVAHVVVDPSLGEQKFFIGNPVSCDKPGLRLALGQTGASAWLLEVHNPTDQEVKTTVQFAKDFAPLQADPITATVPAGSSVTFPLSSHWSAASN